MLTLDSHYSRSGSRRNETMQSSRSNSRAVAFLRHHFAPVEIQRPEYFNLVLDVFRAIHEFYKPICIHIRDMALSVFQFQTC